MSSEGHVAELVDIPSGPSIVDRNREKTLENLRTYLVSGRKPLHPLLHKA